MTDQSRPTNADPADVLMVVEAFIDGEAVDALALKAALADPGGRDHLVDLLLMREAIDGGALSLHTWSDRPRPVRGRWLAAAAAVIISLAAGYLTGQLTAPSEGAPTSVEAVINVETSPPAPAPTSVISLKPGVNWTEHPRGQ
jgi:hypothetical protein